MGIFSYVFTFPLCFYIIFLRVPTAVVADAVFSFLPPFCSFIHHVLCFIHIRLVDVSLAQFVNFQFQLNLSLEYTAGRVVHVCMYVCREEDQTFFQQHQRHFIAVCIRVNHPPPSSLPSFSLCWQSET